MSRRRESRRGLLLALTRGGAVLLTAGLLLSADAGRAHAQTPITGFGLGYPVAPVDARVAALGGAAGALPGGSLAARHPAALTRVDQLTLGFSLSPEDVDVDVSESAPAQSEGRSRFTLARVVVPMGEWRLGVGFSSELDQDWRVTIQDTLDFAGERFSFRERRRSDGGVSAANVTLARRIGPLSFGVGGERLTGSLDRSFRRSFRPDTAAPPGLSDVTASGSWSYRGWRGRGGLALDLGDRAGLTVSGAVSGDLTAEPDGRAETRVFDYPASFSAAAGYRVTGGLLVTGEGGWTGWSSLDGDLREGRALDTRWVGGGLELTGFDLGPLAVPLRVGGRLRELPFAREGKEQLTERAVTAGITVRGAGGRASVGASLEVGTRGDVADAGVAEDFRRFHFTVKIRQ